MASRRIAANTEILHILIIFGIVQVAVLLLALSLHTQQAAVSIASQAESVGLSPIAIALGYAVYIIAGGGIIWFIMSKLKLERIAFAIAEAAFVIGGVYFLLYAITGYDTAWLLLPGLFLMFDKHFSPDMSNACALLASIGYGILFASQFGIAILLPFTVLLAIGDYIAVYWTKHMAKMAQSIGSTPNALLVTVQRKIDEDTVSSLRLGSADMFFCAALIGSVAIAFNGTAYSIIIPLFMIAGSILTLRYLMGEVQKNLRPYPAMPYIATGLFAGMLAGAALVAV